MHETQGSFTHSFHLVLWFIPQLVCLGSHRPSNLATLVPLEEWNYNQTGKCSLFVQLYVLEVILGILSWCALGACKSSRVAYHPVSIRPCIRVASTATLRSALAHMG